MSKDARDTASQCAAVVAFEQAIGWRGPSRLHFIVYGLWKAGDEHLPAMERAAVVLAEAMPGCRGSLFVASDEGWPLSVGVFDLECRFWPADVEAACDELTAEVCREGSELAWMMFDGVFNEVRDTFHPEWARHIYAIRGNRAAPRVDLAIVDEVRHSARWANVVAGHRAERVPSLVGS